MFIPIGDDNTDRKIFPYVNYFFIIANILVFVFLQGLGSNDAFTYAFVTVPAEILTGKDLVGNMGDIYHKVTDYKHVLPILRETPIPVYGTLLTSTFMHGGIMHLFGNMMYLGVFGDNIENRLGHGKYILFYIATGVIASLCHVFSVYFQHGNPYIPCLGASGAISAVLGAYINLFPKNKVRVLWGIFPFSVPAIIALGAWIGLQVISGLGAMGGKGDGVAYAAHVGGFFAGFLLIRFFVTDKTENAY